MTKLAVILVFCACVCAQILAHEQHNAEHLSKEEHHNDRHYGEHHRKNEQPHSDDHHSKVRHHGHAKEKAHHHEEHFKGKHHGEHLKQGHLQNRHHAHAKHLQHSHRNNDGNQTSAQKNDTSDKNTLILNYNSSAGTEDLYNKTGRAGCFFNFRANITVVYSDRTNFAVAFNYTSNIGELIINRRISNWTEYLSHLNLSNLFRTVSSNSIPFNISSIPPNVTKEIESILKNLNPNSQNVSDFVNQASLLMNMFQSFPNNVISTFQGQIQGDLQMTMERLRLLGCIFQQMFSNGVHWGNGTSLNLGSLLNQDTGINFLTSLIQQPGFNSSGFLQLALHSEETFLLILDRFGGRNNPFDLFVRAIAQTAEASSGNGSSHALIHSLIQLYGNGRNISSMPSQWSHCFQNLIKAIQDSGGNDTLPGLQILQNLSNRNFSINNTNFTNLLNILGNVNRTCPTNNIVEFLFAISHIFPPQICIPDLTGQLFSLRRNGSMSLGGNPTLANLFPLLSNLSISTNLDRADSMQKIIRDFINVIRSQSELFTDGVQLGPLGNIIPLLNDAVRQYSHGNLSLLNLFRSNDAVQNFIHAAQAFSSLSPFGGGSSNGLPNVAVNVATQVGNFANSFNNLGQVIGDAANSFATAFGGLGRPGARENGKDSHSRQQHIQNGKHKENENQHH